MPHFPKPFFKKGRGLWYVEIDREQVNLGPDREAAYRKYHELMAQPRPQPTRQDSLASIVDYFMEWVQQNRAADTYEWYRYRLQRFIDRYPNMITTDVRPYHVQQWVDSYTLSVTSRRNYLRSVKRCLTWSVKQGCLDRNPIEYLEIPSGESREVVVSQAEFDDLLAYYKDQEFRDLLIVTWATGCRPHVEARHIDLARSRWVFPRSEGKTGVHIVYRNDEALAITRRRMLKCPEGPIFRNINGNPWTKDSVGCRFSNYQRKHGKRYSLYALRHSWATHAMERGIDPLTVAILMGHKDPSMLARVYQHLSHNPQHLLEQAKRAVS
ncbi:MAG: tyrosine-type recombinase/integrase [Planctomycetaceae bacterium]|nr:tyrosine-type recombinase/integrase [Planctomycetaceae bacterium]